MRRFPAVHFFMIGRAIRAAQDITTFAPHDKDKPLPEAEVSDLKELLTTVYDMGNEIGLRISCKEAKAYLSALPSMTPIKAVNSLDHLAQTIDFEMADGLFMFIPSNRAPFYDNPSLLGKGIDSKLPDILTDVVEAGNCYSAGRATACVFHLMRVMEIGLQALGVKMGVALVSDKNWQNILDEINKRIKTLPAKTVGSIDLAEVAAHLYTVKVAWRNPTMHPKQTYTLEEADNIMGAVRSFLAELVKVI